MEDIKKEEAIIFLDYLFENIEPSFSKILIDKQEYKLEDVDKKEIKIKFNDIEQELGYKTIEIGYINIYNVKVIFRCDILPGINKGILFPFVGVLRDIILPENKKYKVNIKYNKDNKEFILKNNRLLLINFTTTLWLSIDEIFISNEISTLSGKNSVQIYCADLANRVFFEKEISLLECEGFLEMYHRRLLSFPLLLI